MTRRWAMHELGSAVVPSLRPESTIHWSCDVEAFRSHGCSLLITLTPQACVSRVKRSFLASGPPR